MSTSTKITQNEFLWISVMYCTLINCHPVLYLYGKQKNSLLIFVSIYIRDEVFFAAPEILLALICNIDSIFCCSLSLKCCTVYAYTDAQLY